MRPAQRGRGGLTGLPALTGRIATGLVIMATGVVVYLTAALSDPSAGLASQAADNGMAATGLLLIGFGCLIWIMAGLRFLASGFEPRLRK